MITRKIKFKILSSSSRSCTSEYSRKWTSMYCATDNISGLNDWNSVLIILISYRERSWVLWTSTVLRCRAWAPRVKPDKTWLCSHLVPAHSTRVQYSLGSNVNAPFLYRNPRQYYLLFYSKTKVDTGCFRGNSCFATQNSQLRSPF